jgi:hypothetical protein
MNVTFQFSFYAVMIYQLLYEESKTILKALKIECNKSGVFKIVILLDIL